jgi:hypothetical protein
MAGQKASCSFSERDALKVAKYYLCGSVELEEMFRSKNSGLPRLMRSRKVTFLTAKFLADWKASQKRRPNTALLKHAGPDFSNKQLGLIPNRWPRRIQKEQMED